MQIKFPPFAHLLMGLCLAIIFIASGCTREPVTTDILVSVDFSNAPAHMAITNFQTDKIIVRIKGSAQAIKNISSRDIRYPADLYTDLKFDPAGASQSIQTGNYVLPISKGRISIPSEMILNISPSHLRVHLEKKVSKSLPVRAPCSGKTSQGYIAMEPACNPSHVTVTGPESVINTLSDIQTKPVDIGLYTETFQKKVPAHIDRPHIIEVAPKMILVTVPILEQQVTRDIKKLPVHLLAGKYKATIQPETISITIKGPFAHADNKEIREQIHAFLDIGSLSPGVYARHVNINIPAGLTMIQAVPRVFTVTIGS